MNDAERQYELERRMGEWEIYAYEPVTPSDEHPNRNDALGFHISQAQVRLIIGGNRSGKTEAMMVELAAIFCCDDNFPWWFNWPSKPTPPLTIWLVIPQFPTEPFEDARLKKLFRGDFYLTEKGVRKFKRPLIPKECIAYQSPDGRVTAGVNGNTLIIKSGHQDDLAFTADAVQAIFVDEPIEPRKWAQLVSRAVSDPTTRILHGLTDISVETDYIDRLEELAAIPPEERTDETPSVERWTFTTEGNPHIDRKHAVRTLNLQTDRERMVTLRGMRRKDTLLCYTRVFQWWDRDGRTIKNFQGGTGNWIQPIDLGEDWTRYVFHDPGTVNPSAAVWFAVAPWGDVFAYKGMYLRDPPGNVRPVVATMHEINAGDAIYCWYIDPKSAKQHNRGLDGHREGLRTISLYRKASEAFGINWALGVPNVEHANKEARIQALSSWLDPQDDSLPMLYFFDVPSLADLKWEFKRYHYPDEKKQAKNRKPEPVDKDNHAIWCCEGAASTPIVYHPPRNQTPRRRRRDPVREFMDGRRAENWRDKGGMI